jgi:two-component system sensor histidine kinase KdpD
MQAHAIQGPWPAGERVLACISEDPRAAGLVRYAKRIADRYHAPWVALYVEGRRSLQLTEEERDRIADTLRFAEALGGEAVTVPAGTRGIVDDVIAYCQANNVTQIVIGKSKRSRWFEILHGSVVHDLVRHSGNISVHVIAGDQIAGQSIPKKSVSTSGHDRGVEVGALLLSFVAVLGALAGAELVDYWVGVENVDLVFLTAIVGVAVRYGLLPSLFASLLAALCYNFFFLPPLYTFTIADPHNVAAFALFTLVAVIVSNVGARARAQTVNAQARVRTVESLHAFSRKLAGAGTLDDVLWATAYQTALMLKVRVVILLPTDGAITVRAGYPPEDMLDDADLAAAKWSWQNDRPAGRGSDTLPGARRLFLPMHTGRGGIGVVGIDSDKPGPLLTPDQRRLLDALMDQGALAIERVRLVEDMDRVERNAETERLRNALLTSISHDLKTPLASVIGSAGALRDLAGKLSDGEKTELLATIVDESERLNRFISNLLDMTRLESGAVAPNLALHDLSDVIGSTLRRTRKILDRHAVKLDLGSDVPMVSLDAVLFEQVLFNLLDNAAKYAASGTTIYIRTWRDPQSVVLQIVDEGEGIPQEELEHIFDKFYRVQKTDQVRPGTGLGLAISRGFVEAMHGTIDAANRVDRRGAVFTIRLPISSEASRLDAAA